MPVRIKLSSGNWKDVIAIRVKTATGTWKNVIAGRVKTATSTWKEWWLDSGITIAQRVTLRPINESINTTTRFITLRGTNYRWEPSGVTLIYKFQQSTDNANFTDISGASGTATNPAVGSSNTYDYTLSQTNVVKNSINYYRFVVTATYNSSSMSSESLSGSFQSPTDITLSKGAIGQTTFNLSWTASTGANRYYVYRSTDNSVFSWIAGTGDTTYTVTGLTANTTYYFYVIPVTGLNDTNGGYFGNQSNTVSDTTLGNLTNNTLPTISGTIKEGETVTANTGTWTPTPDSYSYQWLSYEGGSVGFNGYIAIPGATSSSYAIPTNYTSTLGNQIRLRVTANKTGFTSVDAYSEAQTVAAATYTVTWSNTAYTTSGSTIGTITRSPASHTGSYGTIVTAPTPSIPTGYTFARWYDQQTPRDSTYSVLAGASWTIIGNITFYPLYTVNTTTAAPTTAAPTAAPTTAAPTAAPTTAAPTAAPTTAAPTGFTCTSLDFAIGACNSQGCDNSGCASGDSCFNPANRRGVDC